MTLWPKQPRRTGITLAGSWLVLQGLLAVVPAGNSIFPLPQFVALVGIAAGVLILAER
jgi:hypothetical protein